MCLNLLLDINSVCIYSLPHISHTFVTRVHESLMMRVTNDRCMKLLIHPFSYVDTIKYNQRVLDLFKHRNIIHDGICMRKSNYQVPPMHTITGRLHIQEQRLMMKCKVLAYIVKIMRYSYMCLNTCTCRSLFSPSILISVPW